MISKGKGFLLAAALGSILAGPAFAQSHGGGHGGGGGGGGGGHVSGGGGGHVSSGAHFGGGGAHNAGPAHFSGSPGRGYAGSGYRGPSYGARPAYTHPGYAGGYSHPGYTGSRPGFTRPGPGYGYPGHYYHGYSTGTYWGGGYWRGGFWPRAYYGAGFAWYLPILPALYSTYWWGGVPYYYANDVYYTYSPDYSGYVATDPPPVSDSDSSGSAAPAEPLASPSGDPGQVFMYPRNGQSAEQQAQDRTECQDWANQQAGSVAQNGPDYRRAMIACVEGRGYSAK